MNAPLPALPTLAEHEAAARQVLDPATWAYVSGGAGDEHTLQANAQAWQDIALRPRVLRRLAGGHTRSTLLGQPLAHPLLAAPMAGLRAIHAQAESGLALACAALGLGLVLSSQSSTPFQDVARLALADADRGPLWLQMHWPGDREPARETLQRAETAGFEALVLTVDAPVSGIRDRELRAGWRAPPGSAPRLAPQPKPLAPGQSRVFDDLLARAPTWDEVAWLCSQTRLPVLLKGITHPADAALALSQGVAGLIVSNHGGRVLDTVPATARLVPEIVEAACGAAPVLVDGGIRRGTDVLKALALGASAVLVGRPLLHGLAHGGAQGVAQVIRLLCDELEVAMALCGCATLDEVHPDLLQMR